MYLGSNEPVSWVDISRRSKQMKTKSLGLAAVALGCSIGVAAAQGLGAPNTQAGSGPTPDQMHQVLVELAAQHAALKLPAGTPATGGRADLNNLSAANVPLGFNGFHAYNCGWFTPNGVDQWFYVFPQEGGVWFSVNNLNIALGLNVACNNANLEFVHVINSNTGAFDQTESFPYRP